MFGFSFLNESYGYSYESDGFLTEEDEEFMESCEPIECSEEATDAIARIALENAENFYRLAMAVTSDEINHYIATNEEVVYEESMFKSIFGKIKDAIKKAWAKIKGIFQKVFQTIAGWVQSDKQFVDKHKSLVKDFKGKVKVKGYEFPHNNDDLENIVSPFSTFIKDMFGDAFELIMSLADNDDGSSNIKELKKLELLKDKKIENFGDTLRAKVIPGYNEKTLSSSDFRKELDKYLRNGESDPKTITFTSSDADKLLFEIEKCKESKKCAQTSYAAAENTFKGMIKEANRIEAEVNRYAMKNGEKKGASKLSSLVGQFSTCCNQAISIDHTIMSAHIAAINAAHSQAKTVVNAMVVADKNGENKDKKKKSKNESALESFELI